MQLPPDLEIADGYWQCRPRGRFTLVDAVQFVSRAIAYCRDQKTRRLVVDLTGTIGIAIPTPADRYWLAQEWADESKGNVILAVVAWPEYLDPKGFGVTAAADAGLTVAVFTSRSTALEWLSAQD